MWVDCKYWTKQHNCMLLSCWLHYLNLSWSISNGLSLLICSWSQANCTVQMGWSEKLLLVKTVITIWILAESSVSRAASWIYQLSDWLLHDHTKWCHWPMWQLRNWSTSRCWLWYNYLFHVHRWFTWFICTTNNTDNNTVNNNAILQTSFHTPSRAVTTLVSCVWLYVIKLRLLK